jgi:hypothetical protein
MNIFDQALREYLRIALRDFEDRLGHYPVEKGVAPGFQFG